MLSFHKPLLAATASLCLTTALTFPTYAAAQVSETLPDESAAAEGTATPIAVPTPNVAQDRDVYPASYFDTYVPRTALDMVS